jgi:hypothetical protein
MKNSIPYLHILLSCFLFLSACEEGDIQVETGKVSDILPTTATITGQILSVGRGVTNYGHCYDKSPNPTIAQPRTEFYVAIGVGSYTSFLQGLEPGTKYYVKAYVSRGSLTVYGSEISFTTALSGTP